MAERYATLDVSEEVYRALEREAAMEGISLGDLQRLVYKTYFAIAMLVRDPKSKVIIETGGVSYNLTSVTGFNIEDILGDPGEDLTF